MKKRCLLILCLLTLVLRGIEAKISAIPSRPVAGEQFMVELTVDTMQDFSLELPPLPAGLQISSRPVSRSVNSSMINGRYSGSAVYALPAVADRAGSCSIPPFTLKIKGRTVKTNALQLDIRDAASLPDDQKISAVLTIIPPRKVYVGELLRADLELFIPETQQLNDIRSIRLENIGTPLFVTSQGQRSNFVQSGKPYRRGRGTVVEFQSHFQVLAAGEFLPECQLELLIPVKSGFYDPFFMQTSVTSRTIKAFSPAKLQILPRPPLPAGAVDTGLTGNWTVAAALNKQDLRAGDIAELTLTFTGNIPVLNFKAPAVSIPDARIYPPEVNYADQQQRVTVKYPFVPLKSGKLTLQLPLAVLNPLTGRYIIRKQDISCDVKANASLLSPAPAPRFRPPETPDHAAEIDADLAPLELLPPGKAPVKLPLIRNVKSLIVIMSAAAVLLLAAAFIPRKQKNLKRRKALKQLISAVKLHGGEALLTSGTADIAEALALPPGASPAEIAAVVSDTDVQEFFHQLQSAAYNPVLTPLPDTPPLRKKLVHFLKSLLIFAAVFFFPVLHAGSYADAQHAFDSGNYSGSQKILQELISQQRPGAVDPRLYYDLGCAEYMCKNYAAAYVNFRRAALLQPAESRFVHAAELAEKHLPAAGNMDVPRIIRQAAFLRPDTYILISAAAFLIFSILLFFRRKLNRLLLKTAAISAAAVVAVTIVLAVLVHSYLYDPEYAVVTAARCELSSIPASSGGSRSALPPGTRVRICGENGSFYRVSAPDISGWLPREDVERIFFK